MRLERSSYVVVVAIVLAIVLASYTVFALSQPGMPPNPDLNLIETAVENAHSTDDAALKALRLEALAFYSILTADQQALVINALQKQQLQRDKRLPPQGKDQSVVIQLGQTI